MRAREFFSRLRIIFSQNQKGGPSFFRLQRAPRPQLLGDFPNTPPPTLRPVGEPAKAQAYEGSGMRRLKHAPLRRDGVGHWGAGAGAWASLARATSPAQADERAGCELLAAVLEGWRCRLQPFGVG